MPAQFGFPVQGRGLGAGIGLAGISSREREGRLNRNQALWENFLQNKLLRKGQQDANANARKNREAGFIQQGVGMAGEMAGQGLGFALAAPYMDKLFAMMDEGGGVPNLAAGVLEEGIAGSGDWGGDLMGQIGNFDEEEFRRMMAAGGGRYGR